MLRGHDQHGVGRHHRVQFLLRHLRGPLNLTGKALGEGHVCAPVQSQLVTSGEDCVLDLLDRDGVGDRASDVDPHVRTLSAANDRPGGRPEMAAIRSVVPMSGRPYQIFWRGGRECHRTP